MKEYVGRQRDAHDHEQMEIWPGGVQDFLSTIVSRA